MYCTDRETESQQRIHLFQDPQLIMSRLGLLGSRPPTQCVGTCLESPLSYCRSSLPHSGVTGLQLLSN